ncbi:MAG: prenyltransferase [Flaviaesturariibacter sp.]|nr:prenyltransferase [Flaviaesturariibacter sp.]
MFHPSTIQLLRFHFSLFLLPVYLFALSQLPSVDVGNAAIVFFILHVLVYPASNGYNSFMDRDTAPIGGLESPLPPTRQLFYVTVGMDAVAIGLSFLVTPLFAAGVGLYIAASRAYSYRGIRLKRFPVLGFLTVFLFQGALVFYLSYHGSSAVHSLRVPLLPLLLASLLIGALYPLTQVYQHAADRADGVETLSSLLGYRGTFLFSALLFGAATAGFYFLFGAGHLNYWVGFLVSTGPAVGFFLYWMTSVWRNEAAANFRNSLRMNVLATLGTTAFFITLNLLRT